VREENLHGQYRHALNKRARERNFLIISTKEYEEFEFKEKTAKKVFRECSKMSYGCDSRAKDLNYKATRLLLPATSVRSLSSSHF
jgi:hypothetical protein